MQKQSQGTLLFAGISATAAVKALREWLSEYCGVANAHLYRTHDIRRGHARDLQQAGAPLWEILAAGQWRSPAFLRYLDLHKLEEDAVSQSHTDRSEANAVVQAHMEESSDEENGELSQLIERMTSELDHDFP